MRIISILTYLLVGVVVLASCTKLDEKELLYDTVTADEFYNNARELTSAIGAAYTPLYGLGGSGNIFGMNEVCTDEVVVPTRGADWGDGGHWVRLQTHTYTPQDPTPNSSWNLLFNGVNACNRLLTIFQPLGTDESRAFVAELKALRAIYYYWLLDMFGNVPISTDFTATAPPANSTRAQVYAFVEKELKENLPLLKKTGPRDEATYGRVNYYTAYATLAKLYLNAQVYTGTPQWDNAIAAADTIINSNRYALMPNYRDNFIRDNKGSTEFIWAIPFDQVFATGFNMNMMTLHLQSQNTYNMNAQPWNGFATIQEFYQSYIDPVQNPGPQGSVVGLDPRGTPTTGTLDRRLTNFLVGPQFQANGARLLDGGADPSDPDGQPITFTPYINELLPNAWRQSGARIGKWEFYSGMTQNLSNDLAIFRYADILMIKAEATARKNNNWNHATTLNLVNQIRTRAGVLPFAALTADLFLAERGREMFAERVRREDLIRFGKFNNAWRFHPADASTHVNLFPIPETQINANRNLKQNPGY